MRLLQHASLLVCSILGLFSPVLAEDKNIAGEKAIRAIYLGRAFLSEKKVEEVIDLVRRTELNAVVINTKDDGKDNNDGEVFTGEKARTMIGRLKSSGTYVICRMPVFHDTKYAKAHPGVAVHSRKTGKLWGDSLGWVWVDPTSVEYREYFLRIVRQSVGAGCDEINIDYVRFPSPNDGDLADAVYPSWNKEKVSRRETIRMLLAALRQQRDALHPHVKLSADVFGYTFLQGAQSGIGQHVEDFAKYLDYVYPMSYPCLYLCNDGNFKVVDPSQHPYLVQKVTTEKGLQYLRSRGFQPKVRPWIQAFDRYNFCRVTKEGCPPGCGVEKVKYGRKEVRAQIKANEDLRDPALLGWILWNPAATYSHDLFDPKGRP